MASCVLLNNKQVRYWSEDVHSPKRSGVKLALVGLRTAAARGNLKAGLANGYPPHGALSGGKSAKEKRRKQGVHTLLSSLYSPAWLASHPLAVHICNRQRFCMRELSAFPRPASRADGDVPRASCETSGAKADIVRELRLIKTCQIEVHTKSPNLTGYPMTGSKDITFGRIRDSYWEERIKLGGNFWEIRKVVFPDAPIPPLHGVHHTSTNALGRGTHNCVSWHPRRRWQSVGTPRRWGDTAGLCRICDSLPHDVDNGDERVAWRQELARGLGGNFAALAPIFVHHLDLAAGNARFKLPVSTTRMSLVATLVDFLVDTSVTTGLDEQYQEALMTHGNLRHLTAAICGLALNGKLKLGRCLGLLAQRLWATAAHSLFAESFRWEKSAMLAFDPLRELKYFTPRQQELAMTRRFRTARSSNDAPLAVKCITARGNVKSLNGKPGIGQHAKHIVLCGKVDLAEEKLGTQEMAFLRALIQWDYEAGRFYIFMVKVAWLSKVIDKPVHIGFYYTKGLVNLQVHPMRQAKNPHEHHPEWYDLVTRVNASGGRMEVSASG
ncbi:hypothetical protein B0H13DRAFT_2465717 [Mycena leptocephala]|nr:hypothetical protein B0H13DRAFT_2465717 [Mycena leptocephala]